jgi:hypothetical protein
VSAGVRWARRWLPAAIALCLGAAAAGAAPADDVQGSLGVVERSLAAEDWPAARAELERAAAASPEDCTVRACRAWLELESGRAELAESLLATGGCPVEAEDFGRWALLRALGADRRRDAAGARSALLGVGERHPLWPEHRALVRALSGRHLDGYTLPLEVRAEIALGATSNAFATSPTDAARREAPGSGVARPDVRLDLRAPEGGVTPSLELGALGYGMSGSEARVRGSTLGEDVLSGHSAVWTGSKMIVWGGMSSGYFNTGAGYDPATDTWTATSLARSRPCAVPWATATRSSRASMRASSASCPSAWSVCWASWPSWRPGDCAGGRRDVCRRGPRSPCSR